MSNMNIDESKQLNNFSKRPQTSHGRGRQSKNTQNGIKRREEKHAGLGETSKGGNLFNDDEDSRRQIIDEGNQFGNPS